MNLLCIVKQLGGHKDPHEPTPQWRKCRVSHWLPMTTLIMIIKILKWPWSLSRCFHACLHLCFLQVFSLNFWLDFPLVFTYVEIPYSFPWVSPQECEAPTWPQQCLHAALGGEASHPHGFCAARNGRVTGRSLWPTEVWFQVVLAMAWLGVASVPQKLANTKTTAIFGPQKRYS